MKSSFYILAHIRIPVFVVGHDPMVPLEYNSLEAAREAARGISICKACGYSILEWNEEGLVEVYFSE
jgi:hypothetical protein